MTVFFMVLLFAACIGWTLHTRVLRRGLDEAWAVLDATAKEADALIADLEVQVEALRSKRANLEVQVETWRSEAARVTAEHTHGCAEPPQPLEPQDLASWATFLPTVRVGGALPVTFRLDGSHVVVKMVVPYVTPDPKPSADPNKIPLIIPDGFPVPLTARYQLPAFSPDTAARFLRQIVGLSCQHEIDEQLCVGDLRPFNPGH